MSWEAALQFKLDNGSWMRIEPWGTRSFRIRLSHSGSFADPALARYGIIRRTSHHSEFSTRRTENKVTIRTELAELCVDERSGHFQIASIQNAANDYVGLNDNPDAYVTGRIPKHVNRFQLEPDQRGQQDLDIHYRLRTSSPLQFGEYGGFALSLALEPEEFLYGLGDSAVGKLNKRGTKVVMQCRRGSPFVPIPYVMSSRGWAVATVTTYMHTYDLGKDHADRLTIASDDGEPDLFVIAADSLPELLDSYTDIAGKPTLLPMWAYGLSFIGNASIDARQVADDALKFRQSGIPCELIVLNSGWTKQPDDGCASHEWHRERFPLPSNSPYGPMTFIDILHRHGFKLSVMLNCDADLTLGEVSDSNNGTEGDALPLASHPNGEERTPGSVPATTWYDHLQHLVINGVSAFYLSGTNQLELHPGRVAANGMDDKEMHNLYPVLLMQQMYEGFRKQTGLRPFIVHAMAGYTGIQRFAATPSGRFGSKEEALAAVLGYGLSGHAHTTINMDLSTREGIHAGFLQTWVQVNNWSHVWHPCLLEQSLLELFRTYAKLRSRLIPYLYATAHVAAQTGLPVVRALPLAFPDDPECREMSRQYMLGDFLLASVYTNRVYLPEGVWVDFWTGQRYEGMQTLEYNIPEGAGGPLFIRAGAIIPFGPHTDYIGQHKPETLELHLYPHGCSAWTLIEDDGASLAYRNGQFASTEFHCEESTDRTVVLIGKRTGTYAGMPPMREFDIVVHMENKPEDVLVNGQTLTLRKRRARTPTPSDWSYDRRMKAVRLHAAESPDARLVRIELVHAHARTSTDRQGDRQGADSGREGAAAAADKAGTDYAARVAATALYQALDSGEPDSARQAMDAWWNVRTADAASRSPQQWRLDALNGAALLIQYAERREWPAEDVFRGTLEPLFRLHDLSAPEHGGELLARMIRQLNGYAGGPAARLPHQAVREAMRIAEQELDSSLSLRDIAERVGMHPSHLSRLFHQETGRTFSDYRLKLRMEQAKRMIAGGGKVHEASAATGFKNVAHFSRAFTRYWGKPPVAFKGRREPGPM